MKSEFELFNLNDYCDTDVKEECLAESLKELGSINKKIAKLLVRKEELTDMIIGAFGHQHEGQKTYEYDVYKVEIKTPFTYSLDKKRFESGNYKFPKQFNPIKQSISYSIDKKLCDICMISAPDAVKEALFELIERKPGKASVVLKERI